MTTMIERAVQAIRAIDPDLTLEEAAEFARAVLMAVRDADVNECGGDLYRAGFEAMFDAKFKDEYPMMSCGWEAMIDHILGEEPKPQPDKEEQFKAICEAWDERKR